MREKNVVLFVDDKRRDLMVGSLIAYQLKEKGITCHLEPLEAYRGCLAAHRPDMIIFNHITASHLVEYSRKLHQMGVLTTVLLNEGLCYDEEERMYNAGKHHSRAHIDYFFCWNQPLKDSLVDTGVGKETDIQVVGPARFDFYFRPWSRPFENYDWPGGGKPKVLLCSNFGLARYYNLPKEQAQKFFAAWSGRIPIYEDYWKLVEVCHRGRTRFFDHLNTIVKSKRFDVVLRPHPREDLTVYYSWYEGLSPDEKAQVRIDEKSNITSLILACDLQVACENCNTTLESWIAKKATVELEFERDPVYYSEVIASLHTTCDDPEKVIEVIEGELANPETSKAEGRRAHLEKWCSAPDGSISSRVADSIVEALEKHPEPDWSELDLQDRRRGLKLNLLKKLDLPYHHDPLLRIKAKVANKKYRLKLYDQNKAVTRSAAEDALRLLEEGVV